MRGSASFSGLEGFFLTAVGAGIAMMLATGEWGQWLVIAFGIFVLWSMAGHGNR